MHCYKITSLKREKEGEYTEYLKYYFFPAKLVCLSSKSGKVKEYNFKDTSKVEEKYDKVLQSKLKIGFLVLNDNIKPIFYNQYNTARKGFSKTIENQRGVLYRGLKPIIDSDGNYFRQPYEELDKEFLQNKYQGCNNLIDLFSSFRSVDYRVDMTRHEMNYVYRFSLNYFDNVRWNEEEPYDKISSPIGRSIIEFATKNEPEAKQKFWTSISKKFSQSIPEKPRFVYLSKGILSFIDTKTEKVYSVEEYEPNYDMRVSEDNIVVHENPVEFMAYVWNRLEEDIAYSLEYK